MVHMADEHPVMLLALRCYEATSISLVSIVYNENKLKKSPLLSLPEDQGVRGVLTYTLYFQIRREKSI